MKNFAKLHLAIGLLAIAGTAFADNIPIKGSDTCYLVQNDKLQKKASCTYKGNANYYGSGAFHEANFFIKGVNKPFKVSLNFEFGSSDGQYTLNGKESVLFSRNKSTFKKISHQQAEQFLNIDNGVKQLLSCVKDKKSQQELCFNADGFGSL